MRKGIFLLIALFLLNACASQQAAEPTILPTLAITNTPNATDTPLPTPVPRSTLPPTWTPVVEAATATVDASNTPVPTPTPNAQSVQVNATVPPNACDNFEPDLNRTLRVYKDGQDATVYWTPVEGAEYYYVALTDETATIVHEDYTSDTSYVFPADLFESGKLYGWEAYPLNALGVQMCLPAGAELFPEF